MLADCDVETGNLYLLFDPEKEEEQVFTGGKSAQINPGLCDHCRLCMKYCRFDAIHMKNGRVWISGTDCEGCGLCARLCPAKAITMQNHDKSRLLAGGFRYGHMVYARLAPGEENSGKLVYQVREKARKLARDDHYNLILIDGPPGIGCPVISAITGVDRVVIVTEPSISGMLDLQRLVRVADSFGKKISVIINKYDLNPRVTVRIEAFCKMRDKEVAGKLPFSPEVVEAMVQCKSMPEWQPGSLFVRELKSIWMKIIH